PQAGPGTGPLCAASAHRQCPGGGEDYRHAGRGVDCNVRGVTRQEARSWAMAMREGSPQKRSEQQPGNLVASYLLDTWGHFLATSLDSLGYSSINHLDRLARGEWVDNRHFQSRVPKGALKSGLGEYLLVEKVLRKL